MSPRVDRFLEACRADPAIGDSVDLVAPYLAMMPAGHLEAILERVQVHLEETR